MLDRYYLQRDDRMRCCLSGLDLKVAQWHTLHVYNICDNLTFQKLPRYHIYKHYKQLVMLLNIEMPACPNATQFCHGRCYYSELTPTTSIYIRYLIFILLLKSTELRRHIMEKPGIQDIVCCLNYLSWFLKGAKWFNLLDINTNATAIYSCTHII